MTTRSRRYATIAAAFLVIAAVGSSVRWLTHPTLLSDASMMPGGSAAPRSVADGTIHIGVAGEPWRKPYGDPGPEETITFHGAKAHFSTNGAGVHATFWICEAEAKDSAIEVVGGSLSSYCTSIRPLRDGTKMRFGSPEYVVATLTPTRSGTSRIDYVTLDYSRTLRHLGQRGTDRVNGGLTMKLTD